MISVETAGRTNEKGEPAGIPAPPGLGLPRLSATFLFGELPAALGLREIGVFSPWAMRRGDTEWTVVGQPMPVNVTLYGVEERQLRAAVRDITFGHEIPYLVILTQRPFPRGAIEAALEGTRYAFADTQASYSQDGRGEPPEIVYLNWIGLSDDSERVTRSIDQAAAALGGVAAYGLQVPRKGTTKRSHPTSSFQRAYEQQLRLKSRVTAPVRGTLGKIVGVAEAPPPPPPEAPEPEAGGVTKWIVGGVAAALGYTFWRKRR